MIRKKRRPPVLQSQDYGKQPFVTDINGAAQRNRNFRTAIWTGENLQMTLMSIPVNGDVGLEVHKDTDQFLYIVSGTALVQMGGARSDLSYKTSAVRGYGVFVPAGTWHNLTNTGDEPLKLYTIYAPPEHPWGTVEPVSPSPPLPPAYPAFPTRPAHPVRPPAPAFPAAPTYPAKPVPPAIPTNPAPPVYPAIPTYPAAPVYPAKPILPRPLRPAPGSIVKAGGTEDFEDEYSNLT